MLYLSNDFMACLAQRCRGVSWLYVSPYEEFGSRAFLKSELVLYRCTAAYSSPFWRCFLWTKWIGNKFYFLLREMNFLIFISIDFYNYESTALLIQDLKERQIISDKENHLYFTRDTWSYLNFELLLPMMRLQCAYQTSIFSQSDNLLDLKIKRTRQNEHNILIPSITARLELLIAVHAQNHRRKNTLRKYTEIPFSKETFHTS